MISIIIPTLNEERSLPSLLDAVCRQGAEYEVIVVDGGSQDRTLEIARGQSEHCPLLPVAGTGSASERRKLAATFCSFFMRTAVCSPEH
jgi:GT2 family glycosyltransferase